MSKTKAHVVVDAETARRLKVYAAAREESLETLATTVIALWLDSQPLVGGPQKKAVSAT